MKKHIFIVLLLVIHQTLFCQTSDWKWLKHFGTLGTDEIVTSVADPLGNIYISGFFENCINFEDYNLISNGRDDIFIAKLDIFGNIIWAKSFGGNYSENMIITDYPTKIVIDHEGDLILAGCIGSDCKINEQMIKCKGLSEIFIAKFSKDGDVIWVENIGSSNVDILFDLAIDINNNIYIAANSIEQTSGIFKHITYINKIGPDKFLHWTRPVPGNIINLKLQISSDKIDYVVQYSNNVLKDINKSIVTTPIALVKLDLNGNELGRENIEMPNFTSISPLVGSLGNSILISSPHNTISSTEGTYANISSKDEILLFNSDFAFSSEIGTFYSYGKFIKPTNILDTLLFPLGNWFNSYLIYNDTITKSHYIEQYEGVIKDIIVSHENNIRFITGNYLSSSQLEMFSPDNNEFINFFVGIKELKNLDKEAIPLSNEDISIYPNPAIESFKLINPINLKIRKMILYDQSGKIIKIVKDCDMFNYFDIKNLSSGEYILSIFTDKEVIVKKLIKQ